MKQRNVPLWMATFLTVLALFAHAFVGDLELHLIQPARESDGWAEKQQIWTMARCGWHWISFDLLLASVGLVLVSFTRFFEHPRTVLRILAFYFAGYALVWLLVLVVSPAFPFNFLKLGQWILLLVISALIYYGSTKVKAVES